MAADARASARCVYWVLCNMLRGRRRYASEVIAADYQQLNPVGGGEIMRRFTSKMRTITLSTVHRTRDPALLCFLRHVRVMQPSRDTLRDFFAGRVIPKGLTAAVRYGFDIERQTGEMFTWLCVTNAGVDRVNAAALQLLDPPVTEEELRNGFPGDPKVGAGRMVMQSLTGVRRRTTHKAKLCISQVA